MLLSLLCFVIAVCWIYPADGRFDHLTSEANIRISQHTALSRGVRVKAPEVQLESLKENLMTMMGLGQYNEVVAEVAALEVKYGSLLFEHEYMPSLYAILGVAYHGLRDQVNLISTLHLAVGLFPNETRAWINLGESYLNVLDFSSAAEAFNEAFERGDKFVVTRLLNSQYWNSNWRNVEHITSVAYLEANNCLYKSIENCVVDSSVGLEFTNVNPDVQKFVTSFAPYAKSSNYMIPANKRSNLWNPKGETEKSKPIRRIKVGLLSSDFNVHPVSQLFRGVIQFIDRRRIELYCFAIDNQFSWWGQNISHSVEHFIFLHGMNTFDAAALIASKKIDILIDLNGHTKGSGLQFMAHKPAPVQMSFLGLPSTTASTYIDYYIGDYVAIPPEKRHHFTEYLGLMKPCYIANDYAQVQGGVVSNFSGKNRASRKSLNTDVDVMDASILFGTVSNTQKIDPSIFHVWMNILNRFSGSKLVLHDHKGMSQGIENMRSYASSFGIDKKRLGLAELAPVADHLKRKTSIDMMLDTVVKNGHTTGLDGIWAGVPTVTMGGGTNMPARASESIAAGLGSDLGLSYSLKEYEDLAFSFAKKIKKRRVSFKTARDNCISSIMSQDISFEDCLSSANEVLASLSGSSRLSLWRSEVEKLRTTSTLFDTREWSKQFVYLLEAHWEMHSLKEGTKKYHVFLPVSTSTASENNDAMIKHLSQVESSNFEEYSFMKIDNIDEYTVKDELSMTPKYNFKYYLNEPGKELSYYEVKSPHTSSYFSSDKAYQSPLDSSKLSSNGALTSNFYLKSLDRSDYNKMPSNIFDGRDILLNVGGTGHNPGWYNVNSQESSYGEAVGQVDIVRNMYDLEGFPDGSVSMIYSSHTLEHNSYGDGSLQATLTEWHRVLQDGAYVLISVPDLSTLLSLLSDESMSFNEQYMLMRMIFGGQQNDYDYHLVGFDLEIITSFLQEAGFCNCNKVNAFAVANDTSYVKLRDTFVSLNVIAKKCHPAGQLVTNEVTYHDNLAMKYIL